MIRGVVLALLTALLLTGAPPAGVAKVHKAKLTCKKAKKIHVRKLSRRERKRVLAVRRRCAKARKKAATKPAPGITTPTAPPAGGGTTAPPSNTPDDPDYTAPPPDDNPHAVQVVSGEFYLNLSKPTVLSGPVRVEFNNAFAEDPHDLHLARQDGTGPSYAFGTLEAGGIEAKTLDLSAGAWQLFCALPEHASRGMTAKLSVSP